MHIMILRCFMPSNCRLPLSACLSIHLLVWLSCPPGAPAMCISHPSAAHEVCVVWRSFVHSERKAAVHHQQLTIYIARLITRQKEHSGGNLARGGHAPSELTRVVLIRHLAAGGEGAEELLALLEVVEGGLCVREARSSLRPAVSQHACAHAHTHHRRACTRDHEIKSKCGQVAGAGQTGKLSNCVAISFTAARMLLLWSDVVRGGDGGSPPKPPPR